MASSQSLLELIQCWGRGGGRAVRGRDFELVLDQPKPRALGVRAAELTRQQLPLPTGASPAWSEELWGSSVSHHRGGREGGGSPLVLWPCPQLPQGGV